MVEKRLELNDEIYGVITGESIEFTHSDTTTFQIPVVVVLDKLVPGVLFDYSISQDDITWLLSMNDSFKEVD